MSWKERKGIVGLLLVVVVGVWGAVGYTLFDTLTQNDEEGAVTSPPRERAPRGGTGREDFVYSGAFRDPFVPQLGDTRPRSEAPEAAPEVRPEPVPEPQPPRVRLLGIIDQTATVESAAGVVRFVRRGDEIEGARVTRVGPSSIKLRRDGRSFEIPLQ